MEKKINDKHPVSIRMSIQVLERLNEFCKSSGQTKTTAIERAVMMYIDDYAAKQSIIENTINNE